MSTAPLVVHLTPTQAAALVRVGEVVDLAAIFPDGRHRSAARNGFDRVDDRLRGVEPDPLELDLDRLGRVLADVRRPDFAAVLGARLRDLLAVAVLWTAVEALLPSADAAALLEVDAIDGIDWRAEAIDLLDARGVAVVLPGERAPAAE